MLRALQKESRKLYSTFVVRSPYNDVQKPTTTLTQFLSSRWSEIQDKTYEHLAEERDLLGIAQTGSGKTGAFLIPIIEKLLKTKTKEYALVVVPTREFV